MPAPLVVEEADGKIVEEARVLPKGYKASERGQANKKKREDDEENPL